MRFPLSVLKSFFRYKDSKNYFIKWIEFYSTVEKFLGTRNTELDHEKSKKFHETINEVTAIEKKRKKYLNSK